MYAARKFQNLFLIEDCTFLPLCVIVNIVFKKNLIMICQYKEAY